MHHGFAFNGELGTGFTAGVSFFVEGLSDGRWASDIAELKHFNFEVAAFGPDLEHVADVNIATRLDWLTFTPNPSQFTGARSHAAGLEEARCPEPFIETSTRHEYIVNAAPGGVALWLKGGVRPSSECDRQLTRTSDLYGGR